MNFSPKTKEQQLRLLAYLLTSPITTTEARDKLDILHPPGRIKELRQQGYRIFTHWQTVDTGKAKHRVARYVLFSGDADV
ncbi:helix-turn-helix domain-containing protein [Methyloglobulus sp.]|uniref:helix-turn-helix domain-containing protein n=1 Tax=Methyloglobulus sp. TaxID=2518622 RepID=UPI003988BBF3